MKFGPVEGTPEEIKNFLADSGLQTHKFFQPLEEPIRARWFSIAGLFVLVCAAVLVMTPTASGSIHLLLFLVGFAALIWLAALVMIRYKNATASAFIAIACLLLLLVALGVLRPTDLLEQMQKLKGK